MLDTIFHGDCLDIMPTIPDASIDMVLADLPYGITQNAWDKVIPFDRLWREYHRVTKPNAATVLTAAQPFAAQLITSNPKMFRYDLIWRKNKSTGFLNANRMPLRQHESILVFYRRLPVYHPQKTTGHAPVHSFTKHTADGNRTALETLIRALVRRLQASPSVSDAEREELGITVPDSVATAAATPTTRPICRIDTSQRLRHTIHFADESTPTRRAKPAGVMGAEIWIKIDPTPPVDPGELTFLAVDTRTPYTRDFDGTDGGKQAHYMLRWVNTRGETGPWSETAMATIGA